MINKNNINLKGRRDKIVDNISKLLSENNIKQRQFCEDLGYDPSTLSKWKNGSSSPSIEMIDAIAKYFNVEAHEIYYTAEELEKIAIKSSGTYNPSKIKENVTVNDYSDLFTPWFGIFYPIIALLLLLVSFFGFKDNPNIVLLFSIAAFVATSIAVRFSTTKRKFIINYLDTIYHKIDNNVFKDSIIVKIFGIISSISIAVSLILVILLYGFDFYTILYIIFSVVFILSTLYYVVSMEKHMPIKRYDNDFPNAFSLMYSLICSSCLLILSSLGYLFYGAEELATVFFSTLGVCMCNVFSYFIYMKKCKEYYLVIEDENGETSKLTIK